MWGREKGIREKKDRRCRICRVAEESVFLLKECEMTKNEVRIEEFMGEEGKDIVNEKGKDIKKRKREWDRGKKVEQENRKRKLKRIDSDFIFLLCYIVLC